MLVRLHNKALRKNRTEERDLVRHCMQYLRLKGCIVIRNNSGMVVLSENGRKRVLRMGSPGAPDIIACTPDGRFLAIECKSKNGKLTLFQRDYLERLKRNNALTAVVKNISDLEEVLKSAGF